MSECRHKNIDPYDCFCEDCGKTCDEIAESMQARIDGLTAKNSVLADCMSEVMAIVQGDKTNSLECIVEHCISELKLLGAEK